MPILGLIGPALAQTGAGQPFTFDALIEEARNSASRPFVPAEHRAADILQQIDYDAHWRIRFAEDRTVFAADGAAPLQFFHLGQFFQLPVGIHVIENGVARKIEYDPSYFDMPADSPARALPNDIGFAGFRIMRESLKTDWVSFLGASYFRTDGALHQYGMSARGLAIDSGLSAPEEFPRFTDFWIGPAEEAGDTLTLYARLESPRVAGAYRFGIRHGENGQVMTIAARLFVREAIERIGIAPLTAMFWYSEANRIVANDWRPEIHDADYLVMWTGAGERVARPVRNPPGVETSSFLDDGPRGFGLLQRDRDFENYQDDGVFYDRRPSVWIEPLSDFGRGSVKLIEIPTDDEIYDNIVAHWTPETPPAAGDALSFDYRIHWVADEPYPPEVARVVSIRIGRGGVPGTARPDDKVKIVVDFDGGVLAGLTAEDRLEPVVVAAPGEVSDIAIRPVVGTSRWRLTFDVEGNDDVTQIELRALLRHNGTPATETLLTRIEAPHVINSRA